MNVQAFPKFSDQRPVLEGRELTTADVKECAQYLEGLAVNAFMARTRVVSGTVREWLISQRPGTVTTHQDFDEAVRRHLTTKWPS